MIDEKIIKSLKKCFIDQYCEGCPMVNLKDCTRVLGQNILNLIDEKDAQIRELQSATIRGCSDEAVKQFAERLKSTFIHKGKNSKHGDFKWGYVKDYDVDNIMKEVMKNENN